MTNIAVLGYGVVGSGTVEVLDINADKISKSAGQDVKLKYILDVRDFPGSLYESLFTKDFETIVNDPDVKVVAEVIGGTGAALEFTRRCLDAGKSVVTSNKELVATHGYELLKLAAENGVNYLFEASVGGGVPIIRPLSLCLSANRINAIYGILNGTTNYILTAMGENGEEFSAALKDAQAKGYAEIDPTADVDGHDACRKLCILSSLAWGRHIYPEQVPAEGIRGVTSGDIRFAKQLGYKIKLLGFSRFTGDKVAAYVAPHLVSRDNLLAGVDGVLNGVVVNGNATGNVTFCGAGAGKMPTASAVVADIIDAVRHSGSGGLMNWEQGGDDTVADTAAVESAWYIRTNASRADITRLFGEAAGGVTEGAETAFITGLMSRRAVEEKDRGVTALSLFRIAT